jgi:hypothetical protein
MLKQTDWSNFSDIDPEYLELANEICKRVPDVHLAGGTLRRLIEGQPYTGADFDLYFTDVKSRRQFDPNIFGEHGEFLTDNATSYLIKNLLGRTVVVQCMNRFVPPNTEILLGSFDIRCCMLAIWTTDFDTIYYQDGALKDIEDRKITLHNPSSIYGTTKRLLKLAKDGYEIPNGQLQEFLANRKEIPLSAPSVSGGDNNVNDLLNKGTPKIF